MIDVRNVSYKVGNRYLLRDISFNAQEGELLSVIGANGAGKSTLLHLLSRDLLPSSGRVELLGRDMASFKIDELARTRAVLAQQNSVSVPFSVFELVMMGRYPHFRSSPAERDIEIVQESLEAMGIARLYARDYNTLSGGEQQRVQFARVLAQIYDCSAGMLLLDEPTNGLDILFQHQILRVAKDLAARGFCVIAILHDMNFASRYSDRVLILKEGVQIGIGSPMDCLSPQNIQNAFNLNVKIINEPDLFNPLIIPDIYYKNR